MWHKCQLKSTPLLLRTNLVLNATFTSGPLRMVRLLEIHECYVTWPFSWLQLYNSTPSTTASILMHPAWSSVVVTPKASSSYSGQALKVSNKAQESDWVRGNIWKMMQKLRDFLGFVHANQSHEWNNPENIKEGILILASVFKKHIAGSFFFWINT